MKTKQKVYLVVTIIIFVTTLWVIYKFGTQTNNFLCEYAYVEKVYDGDTVYTDKLGKIRLIGIDAPEIYHSGWTKVKPYKFYGCGIQSKEFAEKYLKHKNILFCKDPI
jgi:endonuclease YncB( thermonuclease family)